MTAVSKKKKAQEAQMLKAIGQIENIRDGYIKSLGLDPQEAAHVYEIALVNCLSHHLIYRTLLDRDSGVITPDQAPERISQYLEHVKDKLMETLQHQLKNVLGGAKKKSH